jgi:signal transduction histidine kinase
MKQKRWVSAVILAAVLVVPGHADESAVIVGIYENAPKVFLTAEGKPAGFFVDIIEAVADTEGWKLEYRYGTWSEGLERLERGEIDLMPDVAYTPARSAVYAFHEEPVLSDWFQVYAASGSGIRSLVDLDGKRVFVLQRSVQQESFAQLADDFSLTVTLIPMPDYRSMFQGVHAGDADAAITNRFYGARNAADYGLEDTAVIFNPTSLFFAAPREGREALLAAIDSHLVEMKRDPQSVYYKSLRSWTTERVGLRLPRWVPLVVIILGWSLLLSLAWGFILRNRVSARTRELRRINHEMESRIEERTMELAAAMEQARAADRLKSAFLATMSHELRTPLNSIIGFTGILNQGMAGPLNDEQRRQLGMVQKSARHLLDLINDVLDISKIEAGELPLSCSSFPLRQAIERMVEVVSPMAMRKGLELRVAIDPSAGEIITDRRRLEQIILNLLTNAVKFTERGGVSISCGLDSGSGMYAISVSDTGIGIPPEEQAGIFRPFYQVDAGLARKQEGTGLGLSICEKLTKRMGGTIEVESETGKGSTFTVRLPTAGKTNAAPGGEYEQ